MIGGLVTSFIMELLIYPVVFYYSKRGELRRIMAAATTVTAPASGVETDSDRP